MTLLLPGIREHLFETLAGCFVALTQDRAFQRTLGGLLRGHVGYCLPRSLPTTTKVSLERGQGDDVLGTTCRPLRRLAVLERRHRQIDGPGAGTSVVAVAAVVVASATAVEASV